MEIDQPTNNENDYDEEMSYDSYDDDGEDSGEEETPAVQQFQNVQRYSADGKLLPAPIVEKCLVMDFAFFPQNNSELVATSLVDGSVKLYRVNGNGNQLVFHNKIHRDSARTLRFSLDGNHLFSSSADHSLKATDMNTSQVVYSNPNAHKAALSAIENFHEQFLLSGDDDGVVKLWDLRTQQEACSFEAHIDYISDFAVPYEMNSGNVAFASSGDGVVSVMNLRKQEIRDESSQIEDEFLCMTCLNYSKYLMVGTQSGNMSIYGYDEMEKPVSRITNFSSSIDSMVRYTEDTFLCAGEQGMIRAVRIFPNKIGAVIGGHEMPIQQLHLSHDSNIVGSCSLDMTVQFWDVSNVNRVVPGTSKHEAIVGERQFEDDGREAMDQDDKMETDQQPKTAFKSRKKQKKDFFKGMFN